MPEPVDEPAAAKGVADSDAGPDFADQDSPWAEYVCEPCGSDLAAWLHLGAGDKLCDPCRQRHRRTDFVPYRIRIRALGGPLNGQELAVLPNEAVYSCSAGRCWDHRSCRTTGSYRWQFLQTAPRAVPVLVYTGLPDELIPAVAAEWIIA